MLRTACLYGVQYVTDEDTELQSETNTQTNNGVNTMQTNTLNEKEFSRTSDKLCKHTVNNFSFLTVGDQEPEDKMKALAVTLRDSGDFDSGLDTDFADLPIICGGTYFDVWHNVRAYETTKDGNQEYKVFTDAEADREWDISLDSYIDDCMEMTDQVRQYFDDKKWKRDAKMDGRGHSLNSYDGGEEYAVINKVTYYIYRNN